MTDHDDPDERPKHDPITYRNPDVVAAILNFLIECADIDHKPSWTEMIDTFTTEHVAHKTVENTLYDLARFGAIQRVGHPPKHRNGKDTRAVCITTLGQHWLEDTTPPPLTRSET